MLAARTGNADAVNAAAERGRKGRGEGNLERADGADVGGGGGARGGRASADRSSAPTSTLVPTAARRLSCLRRRRGDLAAVRALVAAGADVKAARPDRATPLLVAVINGHEDLVDFLLDKGADPNVEGGSTELTVPGVRGQADGAQIPEAHE